MSRRSVRSRTPKTGRVATRARAAGADLRDAGRHLGGALKARTTQVRCPHCPGTPWVNGSAWPAHQQAHRVAYSRRERDRLRTEGLRQRDQTRAEAERRRHASASRPANPQADPGGVISGAMRPQDRQPSSRVHYVDDDGNRIDWRPGDPLPDPTPADRVWPERFPSHGDDANRAGYRSGWLVALRSLFADGAAALGHTVADQARTDWRWLLAPFRARSRRATSRDGARWRDRTTNPGGNPAGRPVPVPDPPSNVVPIRPQEDPVSTSTEGAKPAPRTRRAPARKPGGSSGASTSGGTAGGSTGHAAEMASAAQAWARATPDTLAGARNDSQHMTEGLAGVQQALNMRASLEVDRKMSAWCMEPYQEAAQLLAQAAERVQEVHARLLQRYGHIAEELAKPDTPDADYLKEGV